MHRHGGEGIEAGDVVTAGDLAVHVIATPGHSSDSVCFLLPEEGSLLTGDTVLGRGTTVVAWPDGRLSEYLVSLARLRDLAERQGIERILPGHGPILDAPAEILTAYLDHRIARLDDIRAAVAAGAGSTAEVVALVYVNTPRELWPAAELSVRAQLQHLRDAGEISEVIT
jgi:glyoxylase-like metal-dependent hydrolase (beta-lactamase superfamily II)